MFQGLISVIGLGKAGLPLAAVIAESGLSVLGVDIDAKRCEMINKGENPLPEEPGLSGLIQKHGGKNLRATNDPIHAAKKSQVHIVIVPVFIDENKNPDFRYSDEAFSNIAKGLKKDDIVVLETTVPPGTTETRVKDILEKESGMKAGEDFYLAYSPERIMTGYSVSRFSEFPKVVGGYTKKCGEKTHAVYKQFTKTVHPVSNIRTAEMIKVSEGIYRDVNIALANELMKASEKLDIDFEEMRKYANHQFCNIHKSGLGVGGHCIPVYPWFLINEMKKFDDDVPVIKTARKCNDDMIYYWRDKVVERLKEMKKPYDEINIGILGINYRSGVKELAYTRTIPFIHLLSELRLSLYVKDCFWSQEEIEKLGFQYLADFDKLDLIVVLNKEDFPNYISNEKTLTI